MIREEGYHAIWHGQRAWNGFTILARAGELAGTGRGLAGDPEDVHSRHLEGTVAGVRVGCLYLPNGTRPGPKFDFKFRWLERLTARASELVGLPEPVVLAGDYNVIPEELDVYNPAGWEVDALFRPESRAAYRRLLDQRWTDGARGGVTEKVSESGGFTSRGRSRGGNGPRLGRRPVRCCRGGPRRAARPGVEQHSLGVQQVGVAVQERHSVVRRIDADAGPARPVVAGLQLAPRPKVKKTRGTGSSTRPVARSARTTCVPSRGPGTAYQSASPAPSRTNWR
jgi:hypothetical protein